jgi:two-component system response regulator
MMTHDVRVLLVEDNASDAELTLHSLRQRDIAEHIHIARGGEEALDPPFCRGAFATRSFAAPPGLVLLDIKLPKVDGLSSRRTRVLAASPS